MRARNVKPSLFKNEMLATSDPLNTWVFEGLWCMADREGRLEDRPRRIHLEINPGRAYEGTEAALSWLTEHGFIVRYTHGSGQYIQIVNFAKHQNPHMREPASVIPPPGASAEQASDIVSQRNIHESESSTVPAPDLHGAGPALSPSPLPDSPSLNPEKRRANARPATRLPDDFTLTDERRLVAEAEKLPAERTFAKFCDHWRAASGARARKADWDATWRNWCRNEIDRGVSNGARGQGPKPSAVEAVRRATAEWAEQRGVDPTSI